MDYSFEMKPDTTTLDEAARLCLIKTINLCETKKKLLNTRVIDEVLAPFKSKEVYICPTFNPKDGQKSPFYKKRT